MNRLDGHIAHLRHLSNKSVVLSVLKERHNYTQHHARQYCDIISAYINQALNFHHQSTESNLMIRPVLQYYAFLNLSVAIILTYKPPNWNQYKSHGVIDRTHALTRLGLTSNILRLRSGAVPLFNSVISEVPLPLNKDFRLDQIVSGFHMAHLELEKFFGKISESVLVKDSVIALNSYFHSSLSFTFHRGGAQARFNKGKLEAAIPSLRTLYRRNIVNGNTSRYISRQRWQTENTALSNHANMCFRMINFGGSDVEHTSNEYTWRGLRGAPYMPTLTSILLTSFALSSIARYRSNMIRSISDLPIQLIVDVFLQEADALFIPAIKNLMYREEIFLAQPDYS